MHYNIGDKVKILTDKFGAAICGLNGIVEDVEPRTQRKMILVRGGNLPKDIYGTENGEFCYWFLEEEVEIV